MARTPDIPTADSGKLPPEVVAYARTTRDPDAVCAAWHLHFTGGLDAAAISRKLDQHYRTILRWLNACKAAIAAAEQDAQRKLVDVRTLTADDVARKRAELLARAESRGDDQLAHRILDSEARRLGLDVTRTESVSVVMQLQALAPEQRRAELAQRIERMAQRGTLPSTLRPLVDARDEREHAHAQPSLHRVESLPSLPQSSTPGPVRADAGITPQPGVSYHHLGPTKPYAQSGEDEAKAAGGE